MLDLDRRILDRMRTTPSQTAAEYASDLGVSTRRVYDRMTALERRHLDRV